MKYIYLGGPVAGLTFEEAHNWRYRVEEEIVGYNDGVPVHSEFGVRWPVLTGIKAGSGDIYGTTGKYDKLTVDHDRWAVQNSDIILMNFTGATRASIGCSVEFGWADSARKPIITILPTWETLPAKETVNPHTHAFITELSSVIVEDLDEAMDIILQF